MTLDTVNRVAVMATTALLASGLGAWLLGPRAVAGRLLDAGLLALMLTPVLRLVTTLADDVRRGDRTAAATTLAVAAILAASLTWALWR
jgi:uncharacterized membrane protein